MNYWGLIYRFAWILSAVLAVIIIACLFSPRLKRLNELQKEINALREENRKFEMDIADLKERQRKFVSDPEFAEHVAMDIGKVRTNAVVFKLINPEDSNPDEPREK